MKSNVANQLYQNKLQKNEGGEEIREEIKYPEVKDFSFGDNLSFREIKMSNKSSKRDSFSDSLNNQVSGQILIKDLTNKKLYNTIRANKKTTNIHSRNNIINLNNNIYNTSPNLIGNFGNVENISYRTKYGAFNSNLNKKANDNNNNKLNLQKTIISSIKTNNKKRKDVNNINNINDNFSGKNQTVKINNNNEIRLNKNPEDFKVLIKVIRETNNIIDKRQKQIDTNFDKLIRSQAVLVQSQADLVQSQADLVKDQKITNNNINKLIQVQNETNNMLKAFLDSQRIKTNKKNDKESSKSK
jgi:hypothetical protein